MAYVNYPKILPFKFVPKDSDPDILGINGSWACEQIRQFEIKATYKTKWKKTDVTSLQIESSLPPSPLKVLDRYNTVHKTMPWTSVFDGATYKVYELEFDVSDLDDGTYYLYSQVALGLVNMEAISEPILVAPSHLNTNLIIYKNSFNRDDVAWTTGIEMKFRCECDIQDYEPGRDRTSYVNQIRSVVNQDGVAFEVYQFYVGDTKDGRSGVAPYVLDILNLIFICDSIQIGRNKWQSNDGSNWKTTRTRGYPLVGASIDVVPATNKMSMQQTAGDDGFEIGMVNTYNIETGFFGPAATIPVIEVQENG